MPKFKLHLAQCATIVLEEEDIETAKALAINMWLEDNQSFEIFKPVIEDWDEEDNVYDRV